MTLFESLHTNAFKTARFLDVVHENFASTVSFYNKDMILKLSTYVNSTNPDVQDAAIALFTEHHELLKEANLLDSKINKNLKGHDILPKKNRKRR